MAANHGYPPGNPPPYPGPPPHMAQPVITQPQVTVVYPQNVGVVHGTTVVPAVIVTNQMGTEAARYVCRSCNQHIITRVERRPTTKTHLCALLLCVLGFWPCVCLPYCMDSCNSADHFCPNCDAYVGSYVE